MSTGEDVTATKPARLLTEEMDANIRGGLWAHSQSYSWDEVNALVREIDSLRAELATAQHPKITFVQAPDQAMPALVFNWPLDADSAAAVMAYTQAWLAKLTRADTEALGARIELYNTTPESLATAEARGEQRGREAERADVIAECERTERTSCTDGADTVEAMRVRIQRGEHVRGKATP